MTTPISENLETFIINKLMLAQQSIKIAVAWFNSKNILNVLCWKLGGGVSVDIILHYDDINVGGDYSLDFTEYKRLGGTLIWAKNEKSTMHVKFCIIDEKILLHGSCNWTNRAFKKNDEMLNVTTDEPEMINSYISNFSSLQEKYTKTATTLKKKGYVSQTKKKNGIKSEALYHNLNNTSSLEERKLLFFKTLQPFESKYDKDYIQTFIDYWLAENNGKLRFEIGNNGKPMNMLGITPEYMDIKLDNWKSKYDIIAKGRQGTLILNEFKKKVESEEIEIRCRYLDYRYYSGTRYTYIANVTFDRWLGKLLFDRGMFVKDHYQYDSFLQKEIHTPLCYPITSIKEKEENAFSDFCVLYEAKQAFKVIKEYNRSILSSIDSQITYKTFCDKYGIKYGSNLKHDKSIKEMVESMKFPIQIEYCCGTISVGFNHTSNRNYLLKLNEIFGFKLLIRNRFFPKNIMVPYKVLYQMDGMQFDFRDDSFENGTMKSIKLPTEYKDASFYVEKIEEIVMNRRY